MIITIQFIEKLSEKNNKPFTTISKEALELINNYNWPGNVRELENVLERAILLSKSNKLLPGDINLPQQAKSKEPEKETAEIVEFHKSKVFPMDYWEKKIIEHALINLDWSTAGHIIDTHIEPDTSGAYDLGSSNYFRIKRFLC